jgi:hypothetical protein
LKQFLGVELEPLEPGADLLTLSIGAEIARAQRAARLPKRPDNRKCPGLAHFCCLRDDRRR